jgi:hypothetical protein
MDVDAEADGRRFTTGGAEPAQADRRAPAFPLLLRNAGALCRFILYRLVNALNHFACRSDAGMVTVISSHIHCPAVEKLKYWPRIAKLLMKVMRRPVGWPFVRQISGLQQRGAHQADLGHLAAHAVDLNPVADANAVLAHEDEPAEKREDEVLHGDGEPAVARPRMVGICCGQPKMTSRMSRPPMA